MTDTAPVPTFNSWLHPMAGGEAPPLSERLIRALEAHVVASAADVATCRELTSRVEDPVVQMLVDMIVQDERRHNALLGAMICRLEEEVAFVPAQGALAVPDGSRLLALDAAMEIAASVRGLIRNEQEGSRHLRHLARQEPTLYGGLYPLLLETIARDAEKHATIMRYLLHRIEGSASK